MSTFLLTWAVTVTSCSLKFDNTTCMNARSCGAEMGGGGGGGQFWCNLKLHTNVTLWRVWHLSNTTWQCLPHFFGVEGHLWALSNFVFDGSPQSKKKTLTVLLTFSADKENRWCLLVGTQAQHRENALKTNQKQNQTNTCHLSVSPLPEPWWSFWHNRWLHNQFSPFFSVLLCPLGLC